jgi:hypothetical protein
MSERVCFRMKRAPAIRNTLYCCSIALSLAGLFACHSPTEPRLPSGAVLMQAALPYAFWWQMTEACAGTTGELASVRWYSVPGTSTIAIDGKDYDGYWFGGSNSIVLAEDAVLDGPLVRHEMLHALVRTPRHERMDFVDNCGGVVACEGQCEAEAGKPGDPAPSTTEIPVDQLEIESVIEPSNPSMASDSGWIAISVVARNPLPDDAWALLAPVGPGSEYSATFGYIIRCVAACEGGTGDGYTYIEGTRFGFPGNSVRRYVFDFQLSPGTYGVRVTFNSDTTDATVITVGE